MERRLRHLAHKQLDLRSRLYQLESDWRRSEDQRGEVDAEREKRERDYRTRRRVLLQALEGIELTAAPILQALDSHPEGGFTVLQSSGFTVNLASDVRRNTLDLCRGSGSAGNSIFADSPGSGHLQASARPASASALSEPAPASSPPCPAGRDEAGVRRVGSGGGLSSPAYTPPPREIPGHARATRTQR